MKSPLFRLRHPLPTLSAPCALAFAVFLAAGYVQADVRLPAIFGDHMVLQRDGDIPVWGWADPDEAITVTAGGETATAKTGANGKWSVKLTKLAASAQPIEVTIAGKNKITLTDVLVGDVWVCSGQSNMELGAGAIISREEIAKADHPQIRLFTVPKWVAPAPADDIAPIPANAPLLGKWQVCTPATLAKNGEWSGFSAVAFLFGRDVHSFTGQPVGLISTNWGGTRIHSWISLKTLETMPEKVSATRGAVKFRDHYEEIKQTWETQTLPEWTTTKENWTKENQAALDAYAAEQKQWGQLAKEAAAEKKPAPPRPVAPKPPKEPRNPLTDNQTSCALFNGMIAPIAPYGIKGVIWYQGESNAAEPIPYKAEIPALINDWRAHWGQGDFAFLLVQLPNFTAQKPEPGESTWAATREAQNGALALPNTGLAVTIDLGDAGNIHPPDKQDVSHRLALAAQRVAYGKQDAIFSGPTHKSFTIEGNKIRVLFENTGSGLMIGNAPDHFFTSQKKAIPAAPTKLEGFAIAGADKKFAWANATIDGNSVVIESAAVANPVAVRYAWADNPACNLYNKEGLPASPFRTDDFPFGK